MNQAFKETYLFCEVCVEGHVTWHDGILVYLSPDKTIANIFIPDQHFKKNYTEGDRILIRSKDASNAYLISGVLFKKVISLRRKSFTVQIQSIKELKNKRMFDRFQVDYPAIIHETPSSQHSGILYDISTGGILMSSPSSFSLNTSVRIDLFPTRERMISFTGRILRKKTILNGYCYGIAIEEIDRENALLLNKNLQGLLLDKKNLLLELNGFRSAKVPYYIFILVLSLLLIFLLTSF